MRSVGAWRLPLRLAWREARRAPVRSALVLVMIALPVLAVTWPTPSTPRPGSTASRGGAPAGAAEARVQLGPTSPVLQLPDPDLGSYQPGADGSEEPVTLARVRRVLGEVPAVEVSRRPVGYVTDAGVGEAELLRTDLTAPLTAGLVELSAGRWPQTSREVVVNAALLERGPALDEVLTLDDGSTLQIVGAAESATTSSRPMVFGQLGAVAPHDDGVPRSYLFGGDPVSWAQVEELNAIGATVLSRAVLADPPPTSALAPEVRLLLAGSDEAALTVLVLVVVMVLIEVVLLAGPAFAVGARRQARTLALMAAAGGSPGDARRVVLGSGVVLGLLGSASGVALGLVVARLLLPVFQGLSDARFGPFDVNALHLLAVTGFGLLSALLAAAVPAFTAARQDVVAVLGGRRGDTRTSRRSPVLGLVLVGAGVAGAAYGARGVARGELFIAGSAIVLVLGMVLVVPVVVVAVAALARRLPLSLRFAARDAARHRTRTVPAVAAVAATVAGVVALGIATSSDEAQNVASYAPRAPLGTGYLTHDEWRRRTSTPIGPCSSASCRGPRSMTWSAYRWRARPGGRRTSTWPVLAPRPS